VLVKSSGVVNDPEVPETPDPVFDSEHAVAFVDDQEMVLVLPDVMAVGFAEIVTVGVAGGIVPSPSE
jgi:hypothetical protein